MSRTLTIAGTVGALTLLAACSGDAEPGGTDGSTLRIGASPVPHAQILEFVQDELAEDAGLDLEIVEFTDYVQPNVALAEGDIDANFFQHVPYLEEQEAGQGYDFEVVAPVHLEPLGLYSAAADDLDDLPGDAQVIIPNDPSNSGRALNLLADEGLIELSEDAGISATQRDVVDARGLTITELEAANLPRSLPDADLAVINTNFALEAGLQPAEDALAIESADGNPYANVLVTRTGDEDGEAVGKLADLLASEEVATFIEDTFDGAVVPAG
jgi:D-methionine transport system substrate-binding protein